MLKRNVLFNDALNTFYLQLYGVKHMVKDHLDIERGNLLQLLHRLLARDILYTLFYTKYHNFVNPFVGNSSMGPPCGIH